MATVVLTSNGLELIYVGAYEGDPGSDNIIDFTNKINANINTLNGVMTDGNNLKTYMNLLGGAGFVDGIIDGGVEL